MYSSDSALVMGQVIANAPVQEVLWVCLSIAFIIYGIFSVIMIWHWNEYSTGKYTTLANMVVYLAVSAGLFALMIFATSWYSLS